MQTAAITNLAQRTGIRFLNVDSAAAARLKKSYPVYDSCIIAAGTYPGQEEDVSTVGVKAVLLASDSVSAEVVEELTALLFEEQQELDFALPVELITDADAAVAGISVPFHKGAERYYESRGERVRIELDMYQTMAVAVLALMLGRYLRKKCWLLERFCIPAPVIGGVILQWQHVSAM